MRSIDELSAESARAIEGVVFDVDDTLTKGGIVEQEAYAALFRLRDAGLARIAVTGRPLGWMEPVALLWPIDLAVGENGAGWIWRDGRVARRGWFDAQRSDDVLARVRARVREEMPDVREADDQPLRRCDLAFDVGETVSLSRERIARLVAIIEACGARAVVSTVHAHAMPGAWDKACGTVRAVRDVLGVDEARLRERFLFVGDSGNDAAAFSFFAHTAGVANVRDHLRALPVAPRFVAREARGRGFAEIVDVLLARRRA
ncbi:HAD family hydrolase [Sandaracinus amylolyticus]|uniref:Haloacid dehalogenase-like hydrolase n=1 Tax=Sandaracinus amylolyticus TaxID=927083 RepID=A0A0F6W338_9BACT|nr:HAD-IIB family hydrolase [Sandaracinus amylolyticus]AKF06262.1 haloacid dehalogenase-like hydrolase [Sandaracinus amylolyticus]